MLLKGKRKKGILLPLSSLPSPYGIGSMGKTAFRFLEFLKNTGQDYWQILPLCPVGKGNSPYSSYSAFAGEILYIDLDLLAEDGLLKPEEIGNEDFPTGIDYKRVKAFKLPLLRLAASRFDKENRSFKEFTENNSYWLEDFALFCSIRKNEAFKSFTYWDKGLKYRNKDSLREYENSHIKELDFYKITQYIFFAQYNRLRSFAHSLNIKIIGDLPFYVDFESADVWAKSENFKLGADLTPISVAGVPPDKFSADGQLWGNPIYNLDYLKRNDYAWWKERLLHNARLYDVIRIDHFRAFADYYSIPAGAENAKQGVWQKGMGLKFWSSIKPLIKDTEIIAEDLGGEESALVQQLISDTGFPNMKVLQFAFDKGLDNPFLPKNFSSDCVCYTGTHDNDTTLGWFKNATQKEKELFFKTVPQRYDSPVFNLISLGIKSKAKIVIIPFGDYLHLGSEGRINIPAKPEGNWEWRFTPQDITDELEKTVSKF